MKVYVVMVNDFPDGIFSSISKAKAYCDKKRKEGKGANKLIYWRYYGLN